MEEERRKRWGNGCEDAIPNEWPAQKKEFSFLFSMMPNSEI
jgi:hypothetical protein